MEPVLPGAPASVSVPVVIDAALLWKIEGAEYGTTVVGAMFGALRLPFKVMFSAVSAIDASDVMLPAAVTVMDGAMPRPVACDATARNGNRRHKRAARAHPGAAGGGNAAIL